MAARIFAGQLLLVVLITAAVSTVLFLDARQQSYDRTAQRMLSVSSAIADNPFVLKAVQSPSPTTALQPYAEAVRRDAPVDFITIMAPDGTRFTHPDPQQIGRKYIGSIDSALRGQPATEEFAGALGPSIRAIVPVKDAAGTVKALVAAGVTVTNVSVAANARLPFVILTGAGLLVLSSTASWLLSKYLRRVTLGWGPEQLSSIFVSYDSLLHSVREGLLMVDNQGRLVLYNDHAARLLGLPLRDPGSPPMEVASLPLPQDLRQLLLSGRPARDEPYATEDRILVVSQDPALRASRPGPRAAKPATAEQRLGTVAILRDQTEIQSLAGEVESMRTLAGALRAQTHEHSNRLHTIVSLIELGRGDEALRFAARDLQQSQQLTDEVVAAVDEPFISALLVGKAAQANELGINLTITAGSTGPAGTAAPATGKGLDPADLVTIVGNLLDNAFDAVSAPAAGAPASSPGPAPEKEVSVDFLSTPDRLWIEVRDNGPGLSGEALEKAFELGYSTKPAGTQGRGIGLALVRQAVSRLHGEITVAHDDGTVFSVGLPLRGHPAPAPEGGQA
ncbi:sensor histidine kinase [Arthrobacter sp. I2-34]|uniref:histidine kinase n=1 Tax=Arthrobacter hankyongi TaxID=2904801 RepID=A0ABS9LBI3_9MICC|nr:sensor histidine kinase [Arthrobacter hankyongi]MCG2623812.1 sensor histidine kinase [Arthrobacter hankyongi]